MTLVLITQGAICAFLGSVTLNLWNAFRVVRLYGSVPSKTRRRYLREMYVMTGLGVIAAVLSVVTIVVLEMR